jgi:5-methylcytosine-specific restriction protein A
MAALPPMVVGRSYSWDELGEAFQFKPALLGVGGGMIVRPTLNALLLITHPGGARSFDYQDRWDGNTLIYTGRGKTGDQQLTGANQDVAENRRRLLVFEAEGVRQLRYLGQATCLEKWPARSPDADGNEHNVWKFRLGFEKPTPPPLPNVRKTNPPIRSGRPFSGVAPSTYQGKSNGYRATYEEIMALQEKANRNHFHILSRLVAALNNASWTNVEEIPAAIDLQATKPDGSGRVIFEVKSLSDSNEADQCRAALAQLLEYRFLYGQDTDQLCAVFDRPIVDRRLAFLEALGIAVVVLDEKGIGMCFGQHVRSLSGTSVG